MSDHLDVYVFVSGDRELFGLSTNPLGSNLPPRDWQRYDVMPLSELRPLPLKDAPPAWAARLQ
jgi:hypothetical protein